MKIPKWLKADMRIVVNWFDSFVPQAPWVQDDSIMEDHSYLVESLGFYLRVDKKYITICGDMAEGSKGRVFYIPLGCIKSIGKI